MDKQDHAEDVDPKNTPHESLCCPVRKTNGQHCNMSLKTVPKMLKHLKDWHNLALPEPEILQKCVRGPRRSNMANKQALINKYVDEYLDAQSLSFEGTTATNNAATVSAAPVAAAPTYAATTIGIENINVEVVTWVYQDNRMELDLTWKSPISGETSREVRYLELVSLLGP